MGVQVFENEVKQPHLEEILCIDNKQLIVLILRLLDLDQFLSIQFFNFNLILILIYMKRLLLMS